MIELLDNELENMIGDNGVKVPGLGVIVYKDGEEIYSKFLGKRIIETPKPVTRHTRFRAASVSKMFTIFSIMQLVEQGKITLDDDISNYLGFELRNPNFPQKKITSAEKNTAPFPPAAKISAILSKNESSISLYITASTNGEPIRCTTS